jgi:hypothetical protein
MHTESYPTQPTTPTPAVPAQGPALHLVGGIWIASCPTCGFQLTTARTQERCEQRARPALPGCADRMPKIGDRRLVLS